MAILKGEILDNLNKELKRNEKIADIEQYILSAMKMISMADDFYWVEAFAELEKGKPYYSMPVDYKKLMTITLTEMESGSPVIEGRSRPLFKTTFRSYQNRLGVYGGSYTGKPKMFAIHGGFWYPLPIPDENYTAILHYNAFIQDEEVIVDENIKAVDNIHYYFSDAFRDALNTLTIAYYYKGKEMSEEAAVYFGIFNNIDLPPLKKLIEREPRTLYYKDLY